MPKQILCIDPTTGNRSVRTSYFGNVRTVEVLGDRYQYVNTRSGDRCLVYKSHRKYALESTDFLHLLKNTTDLSGVTIAADSRSLTKDNGNIAIDGIFIGTGESIEIRKTEATTLKIAPGIWQARSSGEIYLSKPPIYNATSISNFGQPWRYRIDTNGDILGLAQTIPTNQVYGQTRASVPCSNLTAFLDSNLSSFAQCTSASYQGITCSHDAVTHIRRVALLATSVKTSYDTSFPAAYFTLDIGVNFWHIESKTKMGTGYQTWSSGSTEVYATEAIDRTYSSWTVYDNSGSRAYFNIEICTDNPCQIKIGNQTPENGSQLVIPESVANQFFPIIASGTFDVVENSGADQWRLRKV